MNNKKFIVLGLNLALLLAPSLVFGAGPFGDIDPPPGVSAYGSLASGGFISFLTAVLRFLIVIGGLYTLFNLILAGFQYMTAANDPKALQAAWAKIWQSVLGLVIAISSFLIAGIIGYLLTQDVLFILNPRIYGP
jgi:hypothetical protein